MSQEQVSAQRLRMLAENVADAVWVLDDKSERFLYVSPSMAHILGGSVEEILLGTVRESMTGESYAAMRRVRDERVLEFERGVHRTYVDVVDKTAPDGSQVTVEVHGRFVKNAETGRLEVIGVSRDITSRRRMEAALNAAHDRLRHAEEFARVGHWEFSVDDSIMHASEGAARLYGFASTEMSLEEVKRCALTEYRPTLDAALRDLIERNAPYDQEFRIRRVSDGEVVHLHAKAEYDAATRRVFGVVLDISDRKRVEEERERLIAELQSAIEQVKTLTGILPICAGCKKIRDDKGYWEQVEAYVMRHTHAQFSHGICPDCLRRTYPELAE